MKNTSIDLILELACEGATAVLWKSSPSLSAGIGIVAFTEPNPLIRLLATSPENAEAIAKCLSQCGIITTVKDENVEISDPYSIYALSEYRAVQAEVDAELDEAFSVLASLEKDPSENAQELKAGVETLLCCNDASLIPSHLERVSRRLEGYIYGPGNKPKEIGWSISGIMRNSADTYNIYRSTKPLEKARLNHALEKMETEGLNAHILAGAPRARMADVDDGHEEYWRRKIEKEDSQHQL